MTRGEIWKDFLKHTVFDLQVCFYQKRRNGIFLCLALLRDSLWDSEDVCLAGSPWIWLRRHGWYYCGELYNRRPDRRGHPDLASGGCCMVYSSDYLPIAHKLSWISGWVLKCQGIRRKSNGEKPWNMGDFFLVGSISACYYHSPRNQRLLFLQMAA